MTVSSHNLSTLSLTETIHVFHFLDKTKKSKALTTFPVRFILSSFSVSMKGMRWPTAFFITRADLITWGRNIFPAPKRSPTTLMPFMRGPSITFRGRGYSS